MEIGQQRVDGAEAIAGRDEDRRLAFEGAKLAVLAGGAFEQPRRSRADGDDAAAARPRRVERLGGRRVEPAPFRSAWRGRSVSSAFTGRKVPAPTCSVRRKSRAPAASTRAISSGVKCSPAVGAATAPSSRANIVW